METQVTTRNGEIYRYKVAMGLEIASKGNLIELTNEELRVKSINTASRLGSVCASIREREISQAETNAKADAKLDKKAKFLRGIERARADSDEINRTVRSDTILIDNELRRRLSPKAIASIPGLSPSLFSSGDTNNETPIDVLTLATTGSMGSSLVLCALSEGIEQMAKLLPSDK